MLKIAICDDEKIFREHMKEMLLAYMREKGANYEVDTFSSGEQFLSLGVDTKQYKILFLDINMEQIDGIMTAKKIREYNSELYIVFVTAFVNYSLEGYKVDAVRYLLKNSDNMQDMVAECMDTIFEKINYAVVKKEFSFVEGKRTITLDNLVYVESRLHKLEFHIFEDGLAVYTLYDNLNHIQEFIDNNDLIRVHQSFLVNKKYIKNMKRYEVELQDGTSIPVPKARYKEAFEAYVAYRGEF